MEALFHPREHALAFLNSQVIYSAGMAHLRHERGYLGGLYDATIRVKAF
jgi:hypothetical protein